MQILKLQQQSPEWHEFRTNHFNASEAPAMLGVSPFQKREELLQEKAFGITQEHDAYTQKIFENGHKFENLYRTRYAEEIIGDDLYPAVGLSEEHQNLSASFDGITLSNDVIFEHKTLNSKLENITSVEELPEHYKIQMEQQLLVSGANKCLFAASRFDENDVLIKEKHFWYESDPKLQKRILEGWKVFKKDLEKLKTTPINKQEKKDLNIFHEKSLKSFELPTLNINIIGKVNNSNLAEYKQVAIDIFKNIKTDLQTDDDFAYAENDLKFCKKIETQIKDAKQKAIQQQSDVAELFAMLDNIAEEARSKRLILEKLTKSKKDEIKAQIISSANFELNEFLYELNKQTTPFIIPFDSINLNLIKGLKTLSSVKEKVANEVANLKIEFNLKHKDLLEKYKFFMENANEFHDEFTNEFPALSQMDFESFQRYLLARIENLKTISHKFIIDDEVNQNENKNENKNENENKNINDKLKQDLMMKHPKIEVGHFYLIDDFFGAKKEKYKNNYSNYELLVDFLLFMNYGK